MVKVCDNTDCKGNYNSDSIKTVEMKEGFGGGKAEWCEDCRKRDGDMIKEDRDCEICGNETSFERWDSENQPPEGEVCRECGRWVCEDCVDWANSPPPICKNCSD